MNATRTLNPLHFEDLEPHRFEDLVRQLAYGFRNWSSLEATGAVGADEGKDIRGIELASLIADHRNGALEDSEVENEPTYQRREWRIQCKRYKSLTPKQITTIVKEAVPNVSEIPHGLIIAAPCKLSDKAITAFHKERISLGIPEGHLWTRNHLEDMLFRPENDHLLFAYFGISLQIKRQDHLRAIRTITAIKRKLLRLGEINGFDNDRICVDCLIRRVDDDTYFTRDSFLKQYHNDRKTSWHQAVLSGFYLKGALIEINTYTGWVKSDGSWDVLRGTFRLPGVHTDAHELFEHPQWPPALAQLIDSIPEGERKLISVIGLLPFTNILEIDPFGDALYPMPHIYCSTNFYDRILFRSHDQFWFKDLDDTKRASLFSDLALRLCIEHEIELPLPVSKNQR